MSAAFWASLNTEDLTDEEKVEALSQESTAAAERGNADLMFELDGYIKGLLYTIPRDEGHGYRRSDEWFKSKWAEIEAREEAIQRQEFWSFASYGREESVWSDSQSDDFSVSHDASPTGDGAPKNEVTVTETPISNQIVTGETLVESPLEASTTEEREAHDTAHESAPGIPFDGPLPQIWSVDHENKNAAVDDQESKQDKITGALPSRSDSVHGLGAIPPIFAGSGARPLQSAHTEGEKADWWFQQLERTHDLIAGKDDTFAKSHTKTKVAILDSGLAFDTREEIMNLSTFRGRIAGGKSFIGDDKPWKQDDYGHGTAVTSLVAKTARHAQIYIARVMKYDEDAKQYFADREAVAQAIRHATIEWQVDIINMSFGWDHEVTSVYNALEEAIQCRVDGKRQPILMFAATSNYGLGPTNHMLWPAESSNVICIDAADGKGTEWADNPKARIHNKLRFTALGVEVNCHFPLHQLPKGTTYGTQKRQTGTSFASAVASGIAAVVLEFARQEPCSWVPEILDSLKRHDIMRRFFLELSDTKNVEEFRFLYPWVFFHGTTTDKYGGNATPGSARWDAAYDIARLLDRAFGSQLAHRLYQQFEARRTTLVSEDVS